MPTSKSGFPFAAVFFDMDGTLLDSEPYWLEAETELMALYGYNWLLQDQQYCLGGPLTKVGSYMAAIANESAGRSDLTGEYFKAALIEMVGQKLRRDLLFMPGAQALLSELKQAGVKTALVSASPRILVDQALAALPAGSFELSVAAEDVIKIKPDPEGYLTAAKFFDVPIENCLILEDSLTGIAAATASKAHVLAIPHLVAIEPASNRIMVNSLVGVDRAFLSQLDFSLDTQELLQLEIVKDLEIEKL